MCGGVTGMFWHGVPSFQQRWRLQLIVHFVVVNPTHSLGRRFRGWTRAPRTVPWKRVARTEEGRQVIVSTFVFLRLLFSLPRKNGLPLHRATSYRSLRQDRPLAFRQFTVTPRTFTFDQLRLATSTRSQARGQSQKPDQAPRPTRATVKCINMAFALGHAVMILAECVFLCPPRSYTSSTSASSPAPPLHPPQQSLALPHARPLRLRQGLLRPDACADLADGRRVAALQRLPCPRKRVTPMGDPSLEERSCFQRSDKAESISLHSPPAMVVDCIR